MIATNKLKLKTMQLILATKITKYLWFTLTEMCKTCTLKNTVSLKEMKGNPNGSIDSMLPQSKSQKDIVGIGNLIPKFINGKMLS